MARRAVLVTGRSGLIGAALLKLLGSAYDCRALTRRPLPGVRCHQADIADLEAIVPAFAGVETVVHLAAIASNSAPFADVLRNNVIGTYNVLEASRRAGVRRGIFPSRRAPVHGDERDLPYPGPAARRHHQGTRWGEATPRKPAGPGPR